MRRLGDLLVRRLRGARTLADTLTLTLSLTLTLTPSLTLTLFLTLSSVLHALVMADCKMHCGVLCLVPGHVVLLKLYLSDNQRMSTSERLPAEPRAC